MQLAIIQSMPNKPRKPVRTDSFAKFQKLCGMIEQTSYLAAHAACHATMNGIGRTVAMHADVDDPESLRSALELLIAADDFDVLVIPGLTDETMQHAICDICRGHEASFRFILDPPKNAGIEDIVGRQKALPRFAALAWPYIETVTPGRRSAELLPPSCVAAPLATGAAAHLRGVHEISDPTEDDAAYLDENGVIVMKRKFVSRRPVIGLYGTPVQAPAPRAGQAFIDLKMPVRNDEPGAPDPVDLGFENELLADIDAQCAQCFYQHPINNADLWHALERTATSVLRHARDRGFIKNYRVRCDEETASWGDPNTPVVEILIEYYKRVREIRFNVSRK